jgi:hypothetical protein
MGWMNILVECMLVDEFYRLWNNFNNEFSSFINGKHANGLNEFLGISSFNRIQNIMFQKSSYKNRPIIYYLGAKIP